MSKIIREITELGNPVLRAIAKPVQDIGSKETQQLCKELLATCQSARGMGIAAPQIGESMRIFVVVPYQYGVEYENPPTPFIVINPILTPVGDKVEEDWEGCLSIPGIRGLVNRYSKLKVVYFSPDGKMKKLNTSHLVSRIFQHENDHLDGVVFLDRVKSSQDLITDKEYFRRAES